MGEVGSVVVVVVVVGKPALGVCGRLLLLLEALGLRWASGGVHLRMSKGYIASEDNRAREDLGCGDGASVGLGWGFVSFFCYDTRWKEV